MIALMLVAAALRVVPSQVELSGAGASQQFVAIVTDETGAELDVTGEAVWNVEGGRLLAKTDGQFPITAVYRGSKAKALAKVARSSVEKPFSFASDIGGIFTKRGCNSSACHGGVKGRGGLKLSANGLHPKDDYEWIVKGGTYQVLTAAVAGERIPRINTSAPDQSLLLTKPIMATPHGGGKRFDKDSDDYRIIANWVRSGAPYGASGAGLPVVTSLEVFPARMAIPLEGKHRVLVTARFDDGHTEDFTNKVVYSTNNGEVAKVSSEGIVSGLRLGETAILIRAPGQLASAGVGVIGAPVANYPVVPRFNLVDEPVFAKLKQFRIVPSELSSDGEFLRRVCLDLTGTLPPADRAREFLASRDPKKREKLVDTLLGSPEYIDYWTFRFADIFRVAIFANGLTPKFSQKYWEWIRNNVETNRPYDDIARERLSAEGYGAASRHFIPYNQIGTAQDTMAEELRVFFGRRLDCAQCHNHPYENWSQDQFWGMAAFFGRMFKMGAIVFDHPTNMDLSSKDVDGKVELLHPRTKMALKPVLLDGSDPHVADDANPRKALAAWMTKHPYFAEAAVNRIWGYFFARGIVDPVDDFRSTNPPTHPELLAALAEDFRTHGHDLRRLMKTIVMSRTYQTSNRPNPTNREDVANYSRSLPRAIDGEVLLDGVVQVTGVAETFQTAVSDGGAVGQAPAGTRAINLKDPDMFFSRFLELYGRPNRGAIPERDGKPNLGQALHMLAGATYVERLAAPNSRLRKLLDSGATNERIQEEFYLAAFTRLPDPEETREFTGILAKLGSAGREEALREFVWALISSREFAENH